MKEDDLQYAKQIFLKYAGSYFHMIRDERYEEYKKYKVPVEIENKWIKEYQSEAIERLKSINNNTKFRYIFYTLYETLIGYKNIDCLKELVKITGFKIEKKEIDSFSQLIISELLLEIVEKYYKDEIRDDVIMETKEFAIENLRKLITSPIKYKKTEEIKIKEEDIIMRAEKCINKWEQL